MMRWRTVSFTGMVLLFVWLMGLGACSKKAVPVEPGAGPAGEGTAGISGESIPADEAKWRELGLYSEPERIEFQEKAQVFENQDIYFGFDAYVLTEDAKAVLASKAEFLKRYPKVRIHIEGHCDDRGTSEYNLALGEKRAHSAYQYLNNLGIEAQRMTTISYGEERPIAMGQTEEAWARNRRDHFVINY